MLRSLATKGPTVITVAPTVVVGKLTRSRVLQAVFVVGFAVLIGLSAQWAFPIPGTPVPVTGQTLMVLLGGAALGMRAGAASTLLYMAMGAFGLPFFAGGESGFDTFLAPSAGYIVGFVAAAAFVGWLSEKRQAANTFSTMVTAFLGGSLIIYAFGVAGLIFNAGMTLPEALANGVYPFVVGDVIKATAAGVLTPAAWRLTR